ncbi:M14 family zinc carboxypeptidase [Gemmatimonadota bacterium]
MGRLRNHWTPWFIAIVAVALFAAPVTSQVLRTAHEESGFQEYTSYGDLMTFLRDVQASSQDMLLSSFGTSMEGRLQPYAIFSRPLISQPWEAMASGKPIILIYANVHGGEKTLRESSLLLVRELATRGTEANGYLDDLVVLVAPSVNLDGFERSTRGNARGIDLNRDYMKLETPETRNLVRNLLHTWHPHISVDGHNGGSYPYNITYQANSHATPDPAITDLCDFEIFPYVDQKNEEAGYRSFWYSGASRQDSTVWSGGGFDPRISRNYAAFINNVGILFESPRQDMETGALTGLVTFKAVLQYAIEHKDRLFEVVNGARFETIEMGQHAQGMIPVQVEYGLEDWTVTYDYASGPRDSTTLVQVTGRLQKKPIVLKERKRPYAYILEPNAINAIGMLQNQDVLIEVLQEDTEIEIEAYQLEGIEYNAEYDHPAAVTVLLADETITQTRTFPRGTFIIRTGQIMGRVAAHLLEPETNDSVVRWNAMDALLPGPPREGRGPSIMPIFKLMRPTALPTKVLQY